MSIADIDVSKRHAVVDVDIEELEAEISAAKQRNADILAVMDAVPLKCIILYTFI